MRAFVNYRTKADGSTALAVYQHLCARLGERNVFIDKQSIEPGALFDDAILRSLWRSDVLVAVMGRGWLRTKGRNGRAIDDPDDWVHRELAEALSHRITVVPLLVNGAKRLAKEDLPPALADLGRAQYVRFEIGTPEAAFARLDRILELPAAEEPVRAGGGQSGGIGAVHGNSNISITDPRGAVHIGDRLDRGDG